MANKDKVVCTVTGIRPDFIRMSEVFRKLDENFTHIMIHTGQHYDSMLSDVFFKDLSLRAPDYNLQIGAAGRPHYEQQALLGPAVIKCLRHNDIKPDIILFLGDANTCLASIPLKKEGYHIGHIEAGMRSGDEWMPEEINRKACDHVCDLLFAYHDDYVKNLLHENIDPDRIFNVGNTIVEVLHKFADLSYKGKKDYILIDIHRHENVTSRNRMKAILSFCNMLQSYMGNLPFKMLQMPRAMALVEGTDWMGSIDFIPLMGYKEYLRAVQDSVVLISDSGTAQEEPPLLGTPVIVPRTSTERPRAIENGSTLLIDPIYFSSLNDSLKFLQEHKTLTINNSWLGDGIASEKIIQILKEWLNG